MRYLIAALVAAACFLLFMPVRYGSGEGIALPAGLRWPGREPGLPLGPQQYRLLHWGVPIGVLLLVWLVTRAWLTTLIALPAGPLLLNELLTLLARRRNQALRDQLQEALLSLATSLKAGQSLPRALERAVIDLTRIHPRGAPLLQELEQVVREVQMGLPIDAALLAFRERVPLEEVTSLVDAVVVTRRRGGNIVAVMGNVAQMLVDRLAIEREIQVMTAQKRAEAAILALIPLGIYLATRVANPSYLEPFHMTMGGQIALGLILLAVTSGYWLANRLARIDL